MPGVGDAVAAKVEWLPRLEESTGIVHSAAAVRWSLGGYPGVSDAVMGYQTRCYQTRYQTLDEYVVNTIPSDSPLAERVTCIECIGAGG